MRSQTLRGGALLSLTLLCLLPSARAMAQSTDTTSFQLEHFEPLPSQRLNILGTAKSDILEHMRVSTGLFLHYANDPLQLIDTKQDDSVIAHIVEHSLKGELWGSVGIGGWMELGFVLPVALYQSGEDLAEFGSPGQSVGGVALSDVRVIPKLRLLDPAKMGGFGVALLAPISIPVGDESQFLGEGAWRAELRLAADWRYESFAIAANVGYAIRPQREARNLALDDNFRYSLGLQAPTGIDRVKLIGSIFGNVQTTSERLIAGRTQGDNPASPAEWLAGVRIELPADLAIQAGGGTALNSGIGAPDLRLFTSLEYTPVGPPDADQDGILDDQDQCPKAPEDLDGFEDADGCPDLDNDGDGIADLNDKCRDDAEDKDGFQDEDGCPDLDNDGDELPDLEDKCPVSAGVARRQGCPEDDNDDDGILNEDDQCPDAPEDKDGFEDADGCPEPDNDGDGIADVEDKCPNDPEDKDGFQDEDGCPDPDNDGDGIADANDQCPNEAETYNGNKDEDGCPDGKQTVVLTRTEIQILERVYFDINKSTIQQRSYTLLDTIAILLRQNPQITKLRIEGHTDDQGKDDYNRSLSKDRAQAVLKYLVDNGKIEAKRLESQGFGEDSPLCKDIPALTKDKKAARKNKKAIEECRATNRRVQFKVIELNDKPIDASESITIEEKKVVEEPAP